MWNRRTLFLYIKLHIRGSKHRLRLGWPLALYVPYQLLLSVDGVASLIPGNAGKCLRGMLDTITALLLEMLNARPLTLADIDIEDNDTKVLVKVQTIGLNGGER
jgi:hypothetical protein